MHVTTYFYQKRNRSFDYQQRKRIFYKSDEERSTMVDDHSIVLLPTIDDDQLTQTSDQGNYIMSDLVEMERYSEHASYNSLCHDSFDDDSFDSNEFVDVLLSDEIKSVCGELPMTTITVKRSKTLGRSGEESSITPKLPRKQHGLSSGRTYNVTSSYETQNTCNPEMPQLSRPVYIALTTEGLSNDRFDQIYRDSVVRLITSSKLSALSRMRVLQNAPHSFLL